MNVDKIYLVQQFMFHRLLRTTVTASKFIIYVFIGPTSHALYCSKSYALNVVNVPFR